MDLEDARICIHLAREAIEIAVNTGDRIEAPQDLPAIFNELGGVFVTLHSRTLRGCVGFPYPTKTIKEAVIDSAISAALYDYRFPPVSAEEFVEITVELTLLTNPRRISGPADIIIGKHGVIVKKASRQGLLLPQVATEFNWTQQEFLDQTFVKAGLVPQEPNVEIFVFEGQIFCERRPGGEVIERYLA